MSCASGTDELSPRSLNIKDFVGELELLLNQVTQIGRSLSPDAPPDGPSIRELADLLISTDLSSPELQESLLNLHVKSAGIILKVRALLHRREVTTTRRDFLRTISELASQRR